MKTFSRLAALGWCGALLGLFQFAGAAVENAEVLRRVRELPPGHPRLFLPAGGEEAIRARVASDPVWKNLQAGLLAEAERQLVSKPVERVLIGRRLLDKSRTALSRVMHLGLAWRLTGEKKYLERARAELLAVSAFADWNPKHFLDVGEMTAAVGIGYDWLYNALDEPTRLTLREAIFVKGLKTSQTANAWVKATNNWNQVCNGGITIGALAVAESDATLSAELIVRAVNTVPISMHEFSPDGAYPEGPGYWGYGTTFNVLLISALQSTLGTDFGLTQQPGFLATADYYLHVTGPSGLHFNYSDAGRGGQSVAAAMFWFAAQRKEPYLLWSEWPKIAATEKKAARGGRDRTDPMLMLWMEPSQEKPTAPKALSWSAGGVTPVAFHRSAWTAEASYVAIKGGTPSASHAHMDVGTFVMDADGVRWADDLGMQDYNSIESKGIDLWGKGQNADRWKIFRLGTSAHNVLMIDGQPQRYEGKAHIELERPGRTVVNLDTIYEGQLASARRGVELQSDRSVVVQDEVKALGKTANVRWAMVTRAQVKIDGAGHALLTQDGKNLGFRVREPAGAVLKIYPTDPPPAATDAPNPGTRMVGFEVAVGAGSAQRILVQLSPGGAPAKTAEVRALAEW